MILKINGNDIVGFNQFTVDLKFDAVASTFSFMMYYDPSNPLHVELFKPGTYPVAEVWHNDELLITGTILGTTFAQTTTKQLAALGGYSKPGVLEDSNIPVSLYPLQSDGLSLKQICTKLIKPFGIKMVVNPLVENRMNAVFDVTTADEKQTVKAYLATLASQKNIIMGHTPAGDIYFTQAETNVKPVYKYQPGTTLINNLSLSFGGQSMHSEITVQKQAGTDGGNFSVTTIKNPFVTAFRPKVINQSSGDDNTTSTAARNALGDELKNLKLTAYAVDWLRPDGKIWRPGDQITVIEPELGITTETTWFIESVRMDGDTTRNTAILNMVLPYVYNNETVKTIFS